MRREDAGRLSSTGVIMRVTASMSRTFALLVVTACLAAAETWPIEKLFSRPFVWGTSPQSQAWSKKGRTLAFLWNEQGNRFLDLYAYHPESRKRVRLTALESFKR
jgi:hypothetical protein